MTNYLTNTNKKIKKTGKLNNKRLFEFNLTAKKTCPQAKDCLKYCFADKGTYKYPVVKNKYDNNIKATKRENFSSEIQAEIDKKSIEAIRIHSSGDFYSQKYLNKWIKIAKKNPKIIFYGYTKSIKYMQSVMCPSNFVFVMSTGGKQDHLIKSTDKKAVIFKTIKELTAAGYTDCSDNDLAITSTNKIGLIFH